MFSQWNYYCNKVAQQGSQQGGQCVLPLTPSGWALRLCQKMELTENTVSDCPHHWVRNASVHTHIKLEKTFIFETNGAFKVMNLPAAP